MFPFLIHHGDFYLPTFFFMVMLASLTATFYIYWQAGKKGYSQIAILDIAMIGTVAGVIGARLFHILAEAPDYYLAHPSYVFHFWQGGFVGYGAFIGIALSSIIYFKVRKLPVLEYADLMALGCPLIVLFVRIGCLGAGCCYGKPTNFFLHFVFTNPSSDAGQHVPGIPVHPTQIYDMINALLVFATVHWVYARKKFNGEVFLVFFMMYAAIRFLIESLRGDVDRGVYLNGMISTSQITGIVIWIVGLALWLRLRKNRHAALVDAASKKSNLDRASGAR